MRSKVEDEVKGNDETVGQEKYLVHIRAKNAVGRIAILLRLYSEDQTISMADLREYLAGLEQMSALKLERLMVAGITSPQPVNCDR